MQMLFTHHYKVPCRDSIVCKPKHRNTIDLNPASFHTSFPAAAAAGVSLSAGAAVSHVQQHHTAAD
jgi:hypothetical protein